MREEYLVFTGRPNSGKSSVIRAVTGLKVTTGKRPGTTRRIERYPIAPGLLLVDMPGYGRVAGAPRAMEERVKDSILGFLEENSGDIVLAVHVLDITTFEEVAERLGRKGYISLDVEMALFLEEALGVFPLVAANKIDKAGREVVSRNLEMFIERVSGGEPERVSRYVFPVSARTGEGVGSLKSAIHRRLVEAGYRAPFELLGP